MIVLSFGLPVRARDPGLHTAGVERAGESQDDRRGGASGSNDAMKGGLDLGGTKIQAVVTDVKATVLGRRAATPRARVARARRVRACRSDGRGPRRRRRRADGTAGIGIGAPGASTPRTGTVLQVANIDGRDSPFPLGPALAEELGRPVTLGNDVNVAVEAERRFGAGRGFDSFLGVFWGTGVGGGIVIDGRHLTGRGSAGEIGHVCAKPGGRRCNCGLYGCVEAYAGRGALEDMARELAKER